jgi:DNA-binding transcriptional ArsR family regulator
MTFMDGLKPDVRRLLGGCANSGAAADVLLLLRRSSETFWSADAISTQIGAGIDIVTNTLRELAAGGFVVRARDSEAYRYRPADDTKRAAVDDLSRTAERP